ncbi:uncharacterized protein A4U43_C05F29160 [Asparagus officinalis]|uniref:Uncharacterized protein n=1 Tax=Asparagus officinalis TaxID=4686 RepID=A0A5P1F0Q4_ASPOF|nr:uncharacterized protein LOC109840826 isoform X2 [Asparagus officinalis]ONK70000.1 uncharacterized protein A4U43_C05F29160 [Asparagus officinalis]
MDPVLIESPTDAKSPNFNVVFNLNYGPMLKESIDRFLSSIQTQTLDFSAFRSIFSRFLQSSADPPLEIILFYCAINYHESLSCARSTLDRVVAIKNLLQCLAACSSSCSGLKSIALLAPAVADLYSCVLEEEKVSGKEGKKLRREIEGLIEGTLSYISICSGKSCEFEDFGTGLLPCFLDLVRVWTVRRSGEGSGLEVFFPLVSREIRGKFKEEGCGVGYLAGVVIVEAFLLKLCLKVRAGGSSREDLQKELRVWAVSSVTVFRNHFFFEILLKLLLDPTLPVLALLDYKDENLIRGIIYDVVILVDYSFINPGMNVDPSYDFMRCIAVRRLIVTHDAIRIAREKGDHSKAISYMSAFSTSCLPHQIIKWVATQIGTERTKKPDINTPQVVLEWLVSLENLTKDQWPSFFEDNTSKLCANLMLDKSKTTSDVSVFSTISKKSVADFFFDKGNVAEDEEMQSMDDFAFFAACRSTNSPVNGKKRKNVGDKEETPGKFIKYKIDDSLMNGNGLSSGSEVDNPNSDGEDSNSDDEMEEN